MYISTTLIIIALVIPILTAIFGGIVSALWEEKIIQKIIAWIVLIGAGLATITGIQNNGDGATIILMGVATFVAGSYLFGKKQPKKC